MLEAEGGLLDPLLPEPGSMDYKDPGQAFLRFPPYPPKP